MFYVSFSIMSYVLHWDENFRMQINTDETQSDFI